MPSLLRTKSRLPTATGVEYPRPMSSICQSSFGPVFGHAFSRPFSFEIPSRAGPRHCAQSSARAIVAVIVSTPNAARNPSPISFHRIRPPPTFYPTRTTISGCPIRATPPPKVLPASTALSNGQLALDHRDGQRGFVERDGSEAARRAEEALKRTVHGDPRVRTPASL